MTTAETKTKIDENTYWLAQYGWTGAETDEKILKALHDERARALGVNVWWYWIMGEKAQDAELIKRTLSLTAKEKMYFWITLTGSGWVLYQHTVEMLEEVLSDESVRRYFLGLFTSEPPPPSLQHGFEVSDKWVWFDREHIRIPTAIYKEGRSIEEQTFNAAGREFTAEGGAIVERLAKPIENPVEAMNAWRESYQRWHKPYLDFLRDDESLCIMSWEGTNWHNHAGYYNLKAAMALAPESRITLLPEINNFDYAPVLAHCRGTSRCNASPVWGVMVGGVGYKYAAIYEDLCGRPTAGRDDYINYPSSTESPGWYIFTAAAFCWAGGGRHFMHECGKLQIVGESRYAPAFASLKGFLAEAGPPMNPETRLALLKGNAFFAADVPGYENGMWEELDTSQLFTCGKHNEKGRSVFTLPIPAMIWPLSLQNKAWGNKQLISGNPYGEADVLPPHSSADLLCTYDKIVLVEWNDLNLELYEKLKAYVKNGGVLIIAGAHLFSNQVGVVDWRNPPAKQFYKNGDLCELCGVTFTGGSVMPSGEELTWGNDDRGVFYPEPPVDVEEVHLYQVKLAGDAHVVAQLSGGTPVVVRHDLGKGSVYTALGPSYTLALREAYDSFFQRLLEDNRRKLSYRVDQLLSPERDTLYVTCDRDRHRFALCNTWHDFEPAPRLTLRDAPSGDYALDVICNDLEGVVARWKDSARHYDTVSARCMVPAHGAAIVHWQAEHRHRFELTYSLMHAWEIYGCGVETSASTTVYFGDVEIFIKRGPIHKEDCAIGDRDVPCDVTVTIAHRPARSHQLLITVHDPDGNATIDRQLAVEPDGKGRITLGPEVLGQATGDWIISVVEQ